MTQPVEVEIDEAGHIHLLDPSLKLPQGRAILAWPVNDNLYPALMSERSFSDWLSPEEDEAWAYLQPDK